MEKNGKPFVWFLKIIRVDNGYYLEGSAGERIVIEEKDDDELSVHLTLLYEVRNFFNFTGTKHDPERIQITKEKKEPFVPEFQDESNH